MNTEGPGMSRAEEVGGWPAPGVITGFSVGGQVAGGRSRWPRKQAVGSVHIHGKESPSEPALLLLGERGGASETPSA